MSVLTESAAERLGCFLLPAQVAAVLEYVELLEEANMAPRKAGCPDCDPPTNSEG